MLAEYIEETMKPKSAQSVITMLSFPPLLLPKLETMHFKVTKSSCTNYVLRGTMA